MNLLKRGSPRHSTNNTSTSNQIAFTPGSPSMPNATAQNQISSQHHQQQHSPQTPNHQGSMNNNNNNSNTKSPPITAASLATASAPLLMGGEHSAFRSLVPSTAALLAASAQLGLARSYAAAVAGHNITNSSTSTPPMSPRDSDEEINVHDDESDVEITTNTSPHLNHGIRTQMSNNSNAGSSTPLQLTKHDRN